MNDIVNMKGKKIIVTGASSGIGKQTAITLNLLGADVILVARRKELLEDMVQNNLIGGGNTYFCADLSNVNEIENLVKQIVSEQGKVDGLVYAAGIGTAIPFMQSKPQKVQRMFDINFFAFIEFVRQICKKGRYNEGMRIVGVSSIASVQGDKAHMVYSASKAAMDAAVRCIAKEVADKGICINTVAPAMTETEMYRTYIEKYGENSESNIELLKRQYLGIAKTQDIANAIAFLLSSSARFITGIMLPVDGGSTTS